jgi:hypothetical protein
VNVTKHVVATIIAACLTSTGTTPSDGGSRPGLEESHDAAKPAAELGSVVVIRRHRRRHREEPLHLDDRPRVARAALERRRDPFHDVGVVAQAAQHRDGRTPKGGRAARGLVELDMGTERLGETASLPVGLEPRDAFGDGSAHCVGAAFVAEPLLDQGVGGPVAAIALVDPGDGDDHDSDDRGRCHVPEQNLRAGRQHEEAGAREEREERERLALSLKSPLDRPRGHELGTWPRVHRTGSSQRWIRHPMGNFTQPSAD